MSKKDTFISVIDDLINSTDMEEFCGEANYNDVMSYWESFKNSKPTVEFTENGQKILQYMQDFKNAPLKAKEIGEGLFMSSRCRRQRPPDAEYGAASAAAAFP